MASKNPGVFLLILMSSAARHHLVRDRYITVLSTCCSHCNMNTQCHRLKLSIAFRRIHPSPYSRDFRTIYVCAEMWVLGLVKASTPSPEYLFNPSTYSFCFCFVLFSIPQFNFSLCLLCMPANHPLRVKLPTSLCLSLSLCVSVRLSVCLSLSSLSLSPPSLSNRIFFSDHDYVWHNPMSFPWMVRLLPDGASVPWLTSSRQFPPSAVLLDVHFALLQLRFS